MADQATLQALRNLEARLQAAESQNQAFRDRAVAAEGRVLELETHLTAVNAQVGQSAVHQQQFAPAPLLKGPQVRKPGTYDGSTKGIVLESWLYSMQTYMSFFSIEEDRQKIALAVSYLSGIAIQWWQMLEESGSAKPETWKDFKALILSQFKPIDSYEAARNKLAELKQTGSVKSYVDEFRKLQMIIGTEMMTEEEAKHRFKWGLKPNVKIEVQARDFDDLPSMMIFASRLDFRQWEATKRSEQPRPPRPAYHHQYNGPTPMDIGAMMVRPHRPTLPHGTPPRPMVQCHKCHRFGHMMRNCPSSNANPNSYPNPPVPYSNPRPFIPRAPFQFRPPFQPRTQGMATNQYQPPLGNQQNGGPQAGNGQA